MRYKFRKKIIFVFLFLVFLGIFYFLSPFLSKQINWHLAKKAIAVGGYTYPIGLLPGTTQIKCFTTGTPPTCQGGLYCLLKDAASCTLYSDIEGKMSGGMGIGALFSQIALAKAMYKPGDPIIAAGFSPAFMDQGVLAAPGGCSNCMLAESNTMDRFLAWFDKYIIAGFKSK